MLTDSLPLGLVQSNIYDVLVFRAVREAAGMSLFALTMDPDGMVWAEPPEEAADEDLVGIFAPDVKMIPDIREALRVDAIQRGFRKPPPPKWARLPKLCDVTT